MSNVRKIAQVSLSSARTCLVKKNYGRAFANFLLFLKLAPRRCEEVRSEFSVAMREWSESLEREGKIDDLFKCYDQACEMFPNHDAVLNNIGAQLFRLGYAEEAAAYIRRALIINPDYLAARENLENICSHLVERWHFRMLNDYKRNKAYREAIRRAINKGYNTVLDIGAGTGILSLIACDVGATTVYACEKSHAMYEVARDVLETNCADDRVLLFHRSSTDLLVPDDLSEKVSLVVTETFDAGLFGEHIVSTLIHAWRNLLCNSQSMMGSVVPCAATMYVCGIESEALRKQNRLVYPVLQNLDLSSVDIVCTTGQVAEEPYTTENLAWLRGGYKMLTNVTELLRVNFCNHNELEVLQLGKDWKANLIVKQHGHLDALAVWFDLHLDECVTVTTGPDTENCWEQAVYPVLSVKRERDTGQEVCFLNKQERLQVTFHFEQDCLRLASCVVAPHKHYYAMKHLCENDSKEFSINTDFSDVTQSTSADFNKCNSSVLPFRKRKVRSDFLTSEINGEFGDKNPAEENDLIINCFQQNVVAMPTDEYLLQQCGNLTINSAGSRLDRGGILHDDSALRAETRTSTVAQLDDFCTSSTSNRREQFPVQFQSTLANRLGSSEENNGQQDATKKIPKQLVEYLGDSDEETGSLQASDMKVQSDETNANCVLDATQSCSDREDDDCMLHETESADKISENDNFDTLKTEIKLNIDVPLDNLEIIKEDYYCETSMILPHCKIQGKNCEEGENVLSVKELGCVDLKSKELILLTRQTNKNICLAEHSDILYVNDIHFNRSYVKALELLSKRPDNTSPLSLLYNTTRLCFLALQARTLTFEPVTMVISEEHHDTIETVMAANNLKPDDVKLLDVTEGDDDDEKYDVIVFDLIEPCGALRQQVLEDLALLRVTALSERGVIVPGKVTIRGLFIESPELERTSHVIGSHLTLGYSIADFINVFQLRNHVDIDLETLPHEKMTEVFQLFHLDLNQSDDTGSLECLRQTNQISLKVLESGSIHALVYWFELELVEGVKISTLDGRSHWRQAGIMMKDEVSVMSDQNLVATVTLQNSCFDVTVKVKPRGSNSRPSHSGAGIL